MVLLQRHVFCKWGGGVCDGGRAWSVEGGRSCHIHPPL